MKRALILALALLASGPLARAQEARTQDAKGRPPADFRLGVVDLGKVFTSYKKTKDLEQRFNDERERLKKELDDLRKQISETTKELEMLDQASEAYAIKEEERAVLARKLEYKKERLEITIRKRFDEYRLQILDDIEQVVKAYGDEHHFTLIVKVEGAPTDQEKAVLGPMNLEALKSVLYFSNEIDITPAIVEILNRRFDLDPGAKASTPTGTQPPGPPKPAPPGAPPQPPKPAGK
jgi:Skp family chaperone for outer membrane proteins